jgi:outer membrane protein assembly factor BamE (lipoprotein component of BamABCDE complex)
MGMAVVAGALLANGCAYALHAHWTLEGRAYPAQRLSEIQRGMTESQVEGVLGAPLEVSDEAGSVTWRYFERAQLRGCRQSFFGVTLGDSPVVATRARIYFTDGVVDRVESDRSAGSAR